MGHPRVLLTQRLGHTWSTARKDVNWFILRKEQQLITSVGLYCSKQFKAHWAVAELSKFISPEKPHYLEGLFICGRRAGISPAWHYFQGTDTSPSCPWGRSEASAAHMVTGTRELSSDSVLIFIVWCGIQCLNPSGIQFSDSFWTSVWQWIQCWINEFLLSYLAESRP